MTKQKGGRTKKRLVLKNATRQIESRHYIRKTNKQKRKKKKKARASLKKKKRQELYRLKWKKSRHSQGRRVEKIEAVYKC